MTDTNKETNEAVVYSIHREEEVSATHAQITSTSVYPRLPETWNSSPYEKNEYGHLFLWYIKTTL